MRDLTDIFVDVLARRSTWDPEQVAADVSSIMQRQGGYFAWERSAGEEWMYLNGSEHERYALIWTRAPLAIVTSKVSTVLRDFLRQHESRVIEADDWDANAYSIDPSIVRTHDMPDFWHASPWAVPVTGFGLLDLVWATL